jgi:hypothetical protein
MSPGYVRFDEHSRNETVVYVEQSQCLAALASSLDFYSIPFFIRRSEGAEVPLENPTMGLQPARTCKSRTSPSIIVSSDSLNNNDIHLPNPLYFLPPDQLSNTTTTAPPILVPPENLNKC